MKHEEETNVFYALFYESNHLVGDVSEGWSKVISSSEKTLSFVHKPISDRKKNLFE